MDLLEIRDYLDRESPETGTVHVERLLDAASRLASLPRRGATPRDPRLRRAGYRYLVVAPHLLFYKVLGKQVRVYRIIHSKRAYEDWL
jgi:toxin ParE1/3/4